MKTIRVRDLRNDYAQIIRDIEGGETFTVTNDGRPVATISPYVAPDGPQTWVPASRVVGALDGQAEALRQLRSDIEEHVLTDAEDPFTRWEQLHEELARERARENRG